jgi:2,3-bisphosphoglycerate-independent phosphoglycerate mutase
LIESGKYHLVVMNFANLDMVGHTGVFEAAVKACESVDRCVEKVAATALRKGYALLVTADHGNAEQMKEPNGHMHTAHTHNPVPLVLAGHEDRSVTLRPGVLGDIAPTILDIMGIEKPVEMICDSLIQHKDR